MMLVSELRGNTDRSDCGRDEAVVREAGPCGGRRMGRVRGACDWCVSPDERIRREQALAIVRVFVNTILLGAALLLPLTATPVGWSASRSAYTCAWLSWYSPR